MKKSIGILNLIILYSEIFLLTIMALIDIFNLIFSTEILNEVPDEEIYFNFVIFDINISPILLISGICFVHSLITIFVTYPKPSFEENDELLDDFDFKN
jgi:hypothetical protein